MAKERPWWIRVDLNEVSGEMDALETVKERGEWFDGFRIGARGHESREAWSEAKIAGHRFGTTCAEEAIEYQIAQKEKSLAGVEARKRKREGQEAPVVSDRSQKIEQNRQEREWVDALYLAYPKHVAPEAARKKIAIALRVTDFDTLMEAVTAYAKAVETWPADERQFVPHPATWFHQRRWEEDRATWMRGTFATPAPKSQKQERVEKKRKEIQAEENWLRQVLCREGPDSEKAHAAKDKIDRLKIELQQLER